MASGIIPKYSEELFIDGQTRNQFLILGLITAKRLNLKIDFTSENGFIAHTENGFFGWDAKISFQLFDEKAILTSESLGGEMLDWGKNKKLSNRFTDLFFENIHRISNDELTAKYNEVAPSFSIGEQDIMANPIEEDSNLFQRLLSLFIPRKGYFITPIIIDINILIWLLMVGTGISALHPTSENLLKWGANFKIVTLEGEWWRIITNCFLHIGFVHLIFNMYALLYIGILLEPILGKTRFATAYLLTGIMASMNSLYWHDLVVSAGASGAIFGMYGVFLALLTTHLIEKNKRKRLLISISIFVLYNLSAGMNPGIDGAAHIGGLVSGILIGYAFLPSLNKSDNYPLKYASVSILGLLMIGFSSFVYIKLPRDISRYSAKLNEFAQKEKTALSILYRQTNLHKELRLLEIQNMGITNWKDCIEIIKDADKLHLPKALHDRDKIMLQYCELRLKAYELLYLQAKGERDPKTDTLYQQYNEQIREAMASLRVRKTN